jgi:hypothetical protein
MVDGPIARDVSAALRAGSLDLLKAAFQAHVQQASASRHGDSRDEMLSLVPFLDCARRLGYDPAIELGPTAATGAPWVGGTFATFVRREISLAAFGWSLVETDDGPAYRFAWPSWGPRPAPRSGADST